MLNDALNALERWKIEGMPPPTEYRLHPDDYAELQRDYRWMMPPIPNDVPMTQFGGLRIVVDPSAPRLPRKAK